MVYLMDYLLQNKLFYLVSFLFVRFLSIWSIYLWKQLCLRSLSYWDSGRSFQLTIYPLSILNQKYPSVTRTLQVNLFWGFVEKMVF